MTTAERLAAGVSGARTHIGLHLSAPRQTPAALIVSAQDDHDDPTWRAVFRALEAKGGRAIRVPDITAALAQLALHDIDVIVADADCSESHNLDLLSAPAVLESAASVVVVAGPTSLPNATRAAQRGRGTCLLKPFEPDVLVTAVQDACRAAQDRRTKIQLVEALNDLSSLSGVREDRHRSISYRTISTLSTRESEISILFAEGLNVNQIAKRLHISLSTVRNHLRKIYRKLGVTRQADLVARILGAGSRVHSR